MMKLNRSMRYLSAFLFLATPLRAAEPSAEQAEFFEKKIRPVLVEQCYSCHSASAAKLKGGLRLDSRDALLTGGDSGPALVAGQPDKSKLIEAVTYKNVDLQMPPKAKLPDTAIADLTNWVRMEAPWPGKAEPKAAVNGSFNIVARQASHWAWKPIENKLPPAVNDANWPVSSIDRFILAKLEEKGITPARAAEPRVLLRRVYFDLIGLPPTPEQVVEFERAFAAKPQAALEAAVDQLLASSHFGERWARHWLDLVRYGESRGHEFDPNIPNAWQYRDYVIRAINADVPYDQFTTEHIAGDLLPQPRLHSTKGFNESILGTGFWHLGEEVHSPVDIRADEADRFDNRIDVLCKTFVALTVACARCHDHKFDAISTSDYYALYGFLRSSCYRQVRFDTLEQNKRVMKQLSELRDNHGGAILKALGQTFQPGVNELPTILEQARQSMISGKPSDNEMVQFWVTYLEKAKKNPDDPFYLWTIKPEQVPERHKPKTVSFDAYESIVDYSHLNPDEWRADDVAFGFRPVAVGEPRFGTDKLKPIVRFHEVAAADLDPAYRDLKAAPGTQNDHGPLGLTNRAGRTLHTPGFVIKTGRVHYLVKGEGKAYAAVDAHTLIDGPLHGELIKTFNTAGRWQWITHDLKDYKGHRAHLEFSPSDERDFSVAKVVQGDEPALRIDIAQALDSDGDNDIRKKPTPDRRGRLEKLTLDVLKGLENDRLHEEGPEAAQLANWMLDNAGLLGVKNWDKVAAAAAPFLDEQAKLTAQIRRESQLAPAMIDGDGTDECVFIRGSSKAPGQVVPRRFLEALAGPKGIESKSSGRLELARQMTDPKLNPFISRVIVNRVWHHLFGRGIVASTDNFGVMGDRPTHPELLDYLAEHFVREGWSLKKLIREMVLSRAYQMSSRPDAKADAADSENLLLHRMRLRRLEGEVIRDGMLSVSGRLDSKMYGPSVLVHLTPFLDGRGKPASGPLDSDGRRSLYIAVRRNFLSPMMLAFDAPSPFSTVGRRTVSNVPAQSLILLNDPFVHQTAEAWGKQLAASSVSSKEKISQMYLQAFARPPTAEELTDCLMFVNQKNGDAKAWTDLAHVMFNVKEFIFVE
jgi:cytochrome c553